MEIQYNDINTKTLSLTGDSSHIIQGQSVVLFSITGEEEAERFQVTLDGKTKTSRLPYFVFGEVTGAGASASVKVIRKDGSIHTASRFLSVSPYQPVQCVVQASRSASNISLSISGNFTSLGGKNSLFGVRYRFKEADSTVWNNWVDIWDDVSVSGTSFSFARTLSSLQTNQSYHFEVSVKDALSATTASASLSATDTSVFDQIYPVGSIYMTVTSGNPGALFGGTWAIWSVGKFPMGADANAAANQTGGSASHTHTSAAHTHTSAAHTHPSAAHTHTMAHSHGLSKGWAQVNLMTPATVYARTKAVTGWTSNDKIAGGTYSSAGSNMSYGVYLAGTTDASSAANTGSTTPSATGSTTPGATGSTTPGNTGSAANHPPYITCYMWRRTA